MAYEKINPHNYTEDELKELWREEYCRKVIYTHDGLRVKFYDGHFNHAFYESARRKQSKNKKKKKTMLSYARLENMMWIKDVLGDETADLYVGYDSDTKSYDQSKRVSVIKGDYTVVIQLQNDTEAVFITAFVADTSIGKIVSSPRWTK